MLEEIVTGKVERVVITYKDRLSRTEFPMFKWLFQQYKCEIVVIDEVGSPETDVQEIYEDTVSLLQCYSTKVYKNRQKLQLIKQIITND